MLTLNQLIFEGRTRLIYQHPTRPDRVLKLERNYSILRAPKLSLAFRSLVRNTTGLLSENKREQSAYLKVRPLLGDRIPIIDPELVPTNLGMALSVEAIRTSCGDPCPSLLSCLDADRTLPESTLCSLMGLFDTINQSRLNFFDYNPANFLIRDDGSVVLADLKGLDRDRSILPLTKLSKRAARSKRLRRQTRLLERINS